MQTLHRRADDGPGSMRGTQEGHTILQGGRAGIMAAVAAAWYLLGLVIVFPASGLALGLQHNPHRYLIFAGRHQILVWLVNILGGVLYPLLAIVLLFALVERFRDEAPDRARIAGTIGIAGAMGYAVEALIKQAGFGALVTMYVPNKAGAAYAFYAMNGTAAAFDALGGIGIGVAALVFGNIMLGMARYGQAGYLSVLVGTPLVLSAFVPNAILSLIASILTIAWLGWVGYLLYQEASPESGRIRFGVAKRAARGA